MRDCLAVLGFIGVLLASSGVDAQERPVPAHRVETEERVIGPFELAGGAVRVVLPTRRLVPDSGRFIYEHTIAAVRFVGAGGAVLFEHPLPARVTPDGFDRSWDVSVDRLELRSRSVLRVMYHVTPSAVMTGRAIRLFGWTNEAFGALGLGITGHGTFVELPPGETRGSVRPVEGLVPFDAWTGHFPVRVPLRADLYTIGTTPTGPWQLRGGQMGDLYVGELAVPAVERRVWDDRIREVPLYDAPEGGAPRTVRVRRNSDVEFGPAYGRVRIQAGPGGDMASIEVEVYRLHVVVDDQEGWTDAYAALGLPAAG